MNNKSWVAMSGLCVLMATSAAQAHVIPICVEAYESGTEVSGAVGGATRTHVTFTQAAGPSSASKAPAQAEPYWRASSGPTGYCVPRADASEAAVQSFVSDEVGPGAGVQLLPLDASATQASLDPAGEFDAEQAMESRWATLESGAHRWGLSALNRFDRALAASASSLGSTAGHLSRVPVNTYNPAVGPQAPRPAVVAGNSGNHESTTGPANTGPGNIANGNIGHGNVGDGNIAPVPAVGSGGGSNVGGIVGTNPATPVPEPETLALFMMGVLGVIATGRRRRQPLAAG